MKEISTKKESRKNREHNKKSIDNNKRICYYKVYHRKREREMLNGKRKHKNDSTEQKSIS